MAGRLGGSGLRVGDDGLGGRYGGHRGGVCFGINLKRRAVLSGMDAMSGDDWAVLAVIAVRDVLDFQEVQEDRKRQGWSRNQDRNTAYLYLPIPSVPEIVSTSLLTNAHHP